MYLKSVGYVKFEQKRHINIFIKLIRIHKLMHMQVNFNQSIRILESVSKYLDYMNNELKHFF